LIGKRHEGFPESTLVFGSGIHKEVNVFRGPREAEVDDGHAADDNIVGAGAIAFAAEVKEVFYRGWSGLPFPACIRIDHCWASSKQQNRCTPFGMKGRPDRSFTTRCNREFVCINPLAATCLPRCFVFKLYIPVSFALRLGPAGEEDRANHHVQVPSQNIMIQN